MARRRVDVIYGSALWYGATKVNCHHLAERLAETHDVLFVESSGARMPRAHDWQRVLPRLLRVLQPIRAVGPRLWLLSPVPLPLYAGRGAWLNSRWIGWQVRLLLALRGWQAEVCWLFHPFGIGVARAIRARRLIYYCVDDYAANPGVDAATVRDLERAAAREASVTIVTNQAVATRFDGLSRDVRVLSNVADTELFAGDAGSERHPVLAPLDALPHPRLGYLGNLAAYKIDLDLVADLARRRPDWSIVLVGPRNQGDVETRVGSGGMPRNVHFFPAVAHALAPAVIARFDVGLLPSAHHDVMQASFPLKFFEYLLCGLPVVARPIPALEPFRAWFTPATSAADFEEAVAGALHADSAGERDARRRFAMGFGWGERMKVLEEIRLGAPGELPS